MNTAGTSNALLKVPTDFKNLSQASELLNTTFNVIGVCVDHLPSCKSSGTDYTITFTLHDPFWCSGCGLVFRFFHKDETKLPKITQNGDVLILRNVKGIEFKGQTGQVQRISTYNTSWVVLDRASLESSKCPRGSDIKYTKSSGAHDVSADTITYGKAIWDMEPSSSFAMSTKSTSQQIAPTTGNHSGGPIAKRQKFSLIRNLDTPANDRQSIFADLLGEVRKVFCHVDRVELQVTDYTPHKMLYNYSLGCDENRIEGDEYGYISDRRRQWPGPWGQMTIQINLWDAHALFARSSVKEGMLISLRNVHLTLDKDGNKLEGHCRGDKVYSTKVNVTILKPRDGQWEERVSSLLQRKRVYEAKAKNSGQHFVTDASKPKRPACEAEDSDRPKLSKRHRQRSKHQKKHLEASSNSEQKQSPHTEDLVLASNTHVECKAIEAGEKRISDILDATILSRKSSRGNTFRLPFQNCRYKSEIRVVDFYPDDIANFSVPHQTSDREVATDDNYSGSDSELDPRQVEQAVLEWEWRFVLLVEDARLPACIKQQSSQPAQMELLVAHSDACFLLNMEPLDLRSNPQQLEILRNKLFVLWGDLEEQKRLMRSEQRSGPPRCSNKPFTCFIKEYGIRGWSNTDGKIAPQEYERMFQLWGATIK